MTPDRWACCGFDESNPYSKYVDLLIGNSVKKGERYGKENICTSGRKRGYTSYCR